jgi:hypothetical protein
VLIRSVAVNDAPMGKPITTTIESQKTVNNFNHGYGMYVMNNGVDDLDGNKKVLILAFDRESWQPGHNP